MATTTATGAPSQTRPTGGTTQTINYHYDIVHQLTHELSTETPTPNVNNLYSFDGAGNRISSTIGNGAVATTYNTNSANQYSSTGQSGAATNFTYTYDNLDRLKQ